VAAADVFVFPSLTDTFGVVLIEAMACGLPAAAYPVTGPKDVIVHGQTGWLDQDLGLAVEKALQMDPERCRARAEEFSWQRSVDQFEANLAPLQ
jgi:glycosyltransferase involved in cell wall biosynthesis